MIGRLLAFLMGLFLICSAWFGSQFFKPTLCNDSKIVQNLDIVSSGDLNRVGRCGESSLELNNWATHQDLSRFLDRMRKIKTLVKLYEVALPEVKIFEIEVNRSGGLAESDYLLMKRLLREVMKGNKITGIKEDFVFELESHLVLTILYGADFVPKELRHNFAALTHEEICAREWLPHSYELVCNLENLRKSDGFSKYSGWGMLPETFNFVSGSYLDFSFLERAVLAAQFLPQYFKGETFFKFEGPLASYARLSDLVEQKAKLLEKLKSQFHDIRI